MFKRWGLVNCQKGENIIIFDNEYIVSEKFESVRTNHSSLHHSTVIATITSY